LSKIEKMSKNLVIVESPAKAKTIESYLGKDFVVKSSFGHVRDLSKKGLSIDLSNSYTPDYEVSSDKKQVVSELKKFAKNAEIVWLATDEDREGEAISWHLYETLELSKKETRRITFNEITKSAILKAIEKPRAINKELVDAQQARRVLDRIVGFELSPILWRKVRPSLSAGRVQSVAVRLIVDREREIDKFNSSGFFRINGIFRCANGSLKAELSSQLSNKEEALSLLSICQNTSFLIDDVQVKPATRYPSAPFTTSTLQQEASLKLGFSVTKTMSVAQRLYEFGKITYMRTDSVNLSETAMNSARQSIESFYGSSYSKPSKYTTKSAGAQEAHEAIRPTDFKVQTIPGDRDEQRLYELIWKRAIASQMAPAQLQRTTIKIGGLPNTAHYFVAQGEVIIFDGFLKVYLESNTEDSEEDEERLLLPKVQVGEALLKEKITAIERFTRPPSRYVEASLVKKLEELGIGRPSTYAPTISTIQKRGYVQKNEREGEIRTYDFLELVGSQITETERQETTGKERNKLSPTDMGIVVTDFLTQHFESIMDYQFTAKVEAEFDEIASGKIDWKSMIDEFYVPFHNNVENTMETSDRATGERVLGIHPTNGRKVIARIGKFGPMVQIGDEKDDGIKPKFASIPKNKAIHTMTLEEALELFKLPRILGEKDGVEVRANAGKFGPYVQLGKIFASIPKEEDVTTISLERALALIAEKVEIDARKIVKTFPEREDIHLLNGKYGAYLKIGNNNYKLPKNKSVEELTLEDCIEIAENQNKTSKFKKTSKKK